MGKFLILSVADHEEHILNKIIETIANEPELDHIALPPSNTSLSFPNLEIRLKEQTVSCNGQLVTLPIVPLPHGFTSKSLKNSDGFPELLAVTCTGQNLAVIEKNSQLCTNGQNQLFLELLHRAVQ